MRGSQLIGRNRMIRQRGQKQCEQRKSPGLSDRGECLEAFDAKRLDIIFVYEAEGDPFGPPRAGSTTLIRFARTSFQE